MKASCPYLIFTDTYVHLRPYENEGKAARSEVYFWGSEEGRESSFSLFLNVRRNHDACENWNVTFSSFVFLFFLFFPVVSPLVRPISKSSAHSISSTTILQRVRRGGFMCWFILDFDICEKQEGFFKVAVHTSRQTALPFCPEDIQSSWLCILDRPLKQILLYKCCGGDTSFLSAYVALRKSVWSSSQSCSLCKLQ